MSPSLTRGAARTVRSLSRRLGRGGGTTLPGRLLLRADPDAMREMAGRLDQGSVLISATNGKTTTAAMVAAILEADGRSLVHNRAGSNMGWGVTTSLLDARPGRDQMGLFEVDEAWLPAVAEAVQPRAYLLSNLFRDQLDRYGELETLADRWAELVAAEAAAPGRAVRFVLNADDPLVADLGRGHEGAVYSGLATAPRRSPSSSTRPTPSTAGTAARPTPTTRCSWATSATTAAPTAAANGPRRRSRPPPSSCRA